MGKEAILRAGDLLRLILRWGCGSWVGYGPWLNEMGCFSLLPGGGGGPRWPSEGALVGSPQETPRQMGLGFRQL